MNDESASPSTPDASASPSEYVRVLLDLLGRRNPFAVQRETVPALRETAADMSDAALRRPEAPSKWSVLDVLAHLADTDLVYGYRLRMIVAHDKPEIQSYDQDRWAARLRYSERDPQEVLDQLDALRTANLRFLEGLSEAEWERAGAHAERGEESVRHIFRLLAAHDLAHLRQVERIRASLGEEP